MRHQTSKDKTEVNSLKAKLFMEKGQGEKKIAEIGIFSLDAIQLLSWNFVGSLSYRHS